MAATLRPPVNGTEQRLDAILAELRALRDVLSQHPPAPAIAPPAPEVVTLREPARGAPPAKPKRR